MSQTEEFSQGKLFPMIVRYSVPAAISLLITAIYNIVDRIFVGNFCGTSALAGLSVCFPLSFLMMAVAQTSSAGGASLFSLFHGSGETKDMSRSFGNSYLMVVVFELVLTVLLLLLTDPILQLFGVTETCYVYTVEYYRIVALGCIFQGISQVCCDFVRVSGKPVMGMCVTGIGAVTNIILDFLFVVVFDMGVQGAAVATVIGQFCSAAFGSVLIFSGRTLVKITGDIFRIRTGLAARIISCGFSFFIAQVAMGLISLVYNGQLGKYGGDTAISVYAVVSSVMTFVIMPASGISQGIQPILGNNYGAGKYHRVMETLGKASVLSVGITCVIWVGVLLFARQLIFLFGGGEEMVAIGVSGLRINFVITPILGFVMLATTFFQSLGKPAPSILITAFRQIIFLIPFIYILPVFLGINGIFWAQPISDAFALVLSLVLTLRERKTLYRMEANAE